MKLTVLIYSDGNVTAIDGNNNKVPIYSGTWAVLHKIKSNIRLTSRFSDKSLMIKEVVFFFVVRTVNDANPHTDYSSPITEDQFRQFVKYIKKR